MAKPAILAKCSECGRRYLDYLGYWADCHFGRRDELDEFLAGVVEWMGEREAFLAKNAGEWRQLSKVFPPDKASNATQEYMEADLASVRKFLSQARALQRQRAE